MEAVQACAKKTIFRSLKNCFSAKPQFSPRFWANNVPGPHVYPHIDFCVDWSRMCEKKSEVEKMFFRKASVFFQPIGENNVSGPQAYPNIDFAWIGSNPSMCEKKQFFGT